MSLIDDMFAAVSRLCGEPSVVRIEHASPDFIDGLRRKCTVHDTTLAPGTRFAGIPIVTNTKLPLGTVRTVWSDGRYEDKHAALFTDPFAPARHAPGASA